MKITIEYKDGHTYETMYASDAAMIAEIRDMDSEMPQERVQELVDISREIYFDRDELRVPENVARAVYEKQHILTGDNFWEHLPAIAELAWSYEM